MRVDQPDPPARQAMSFHKIQNFLLRRLLRLRKGFEQGKNFRPVFKVSAGQLANDERVHHHPFLQQQLPEMTVDLFEMIDPD